MQEEFQALQANQTWDLVLPTSPVKVFGNKCIFRIKYNLDGFISRYKARFFAKVFQQTHVVGYTETFSLAVKTSIIRVILSLAV